MRHAVRTSFLLTYLENAHQTLGVADGPAKPARTGRTVSGVYVCVMKMKTCSCRRMGFRGVLVDPWRPRVKWAPLVGMAPRMAPVQLPTDHTASTGGLAN